MSQKIQAKLRRERALKLFTALGLIVCGVVLLFAIDNLLISFVLAFVINYLLAPLVSRLERTGISRTLATVIPFLGAGILLTIGIAVLMPKISSQIAVLELQFPKYQQELVALMGRTELRLKSIFSGYEFKIADYVNSWLIGKTAELSTWVPSAVSQSLTVMILAPFLAYFMLQDGRKLVRTLIGMFPNNLFELALNLQHQLNDQMGGFIRARFLEAAIVGVVVWGGLAIIGFPYSLFLAIFAGLTNLIPYIGPVIGAVPALIIALVSEEGAIYAPMSVNLFFVTSVYFIAQLIDMVFIIPFVVARIVNLHPVTVILVIIIGAQVMGILGMVISIPLASAAKLTLTAVYNHLLEFRS